MAQARDALAGHPDRERWNARYRDRVVVSAPHPLAEQALAAALPDGPVVDLACGPSGSALLAAGRGRAVTAVDVSEVALRLLMAEARRRGLDALITPVHADLAVWRPDPGGYALVLCAGFWDREVFRRAVQAVRADGLLAWEAFTDRARQARPGLPPQWTLGPGEPASLLPAGFEVLQAREAGQEERGAKRRLLARRPFPSGH